MLVFPIEQNIEKYEINEVANDTFPVPSGNKIRET
jgi:hypothetical protein